MYNEHFGLKERPFKSVPDPEFFYNGNREQEVLNRIKLYLEDPAVSLFVLSGEVGAGKTLLLKVLARTWSHIFTIVSLTYSGDDPVHYLRSVISQLGGNLDVVRDLDTGRDALRDTLKESAEQKQVLLLLDEAQNLPFKMMSELLAAIEPLEIKVILSGLYGLRGNARLASRGLGRMEAYDSCHLGPIEENEFPAYISHRISISGGDAGSLFGQNTLPEVLKVSKGIPRLINKICDLSLLNAYFVEKKQVTLGIVKDVTSEILENREELPELTPFPALPRPGAPQSAIATDTGRITDRSTYEAAKPEGDTSEPVEMRNTLIAGIEAKRTVAEAMATLRSMGLSGRDIFDLFADAMKEHTGGEEASPPKGSDVGRTITLHPRLSVLLMEKNPRMRMHIENRCTELEFNPVPVKTMDELSEAVSKAPPSELQILVADFDAFSGQPTGTEAALGHLGTIRYSFPHLPVIVTSVLPLLAIRSRLLYLDMPYLLHKPDLGRTNLSDVRREFGKFFYELYRCISSIHSHTEAIILKAYNEALGLVPGPDHGRVRSETRREG